MSLALAMASAAVLGVFFIALLHGPRPEADQSIMSLSLAQFPKSPPRPRHRASETPVPVAVPTPRTPPTNPLSGPDLQQLMQDAAHESAERARPGVFLESPAERDSDLARALRAPGKPGSLQEGQGYRSRDGAAIAKTGNGCASIHELQMGPSPTNKTIVGMMVDCPGEYQRTMSDALSAWADKAHQSQSPPRF